MASGGVGLVARQLHRLFGGGGTVAGLTEVQLLERFLSRRDEAAFEALMARYGPMVLSVCRQLLDDPNDVDDAFQATFLVLVRKASTLRRRELLGNWLYGVAHRVATRAKADAAKRRRREKSAEFETEEAADPMGTPNDLQPLHEELARLPENYRAPVVLCYLEGLSHEEAAQRLAWPLGSVKGRLSRARDLLRERLVRRGVAPPAGALLIALGRDAKSAVVPDALRVSTIRAATAIAAGKTIAAGTISATATALAEGVIQTMFATKMRLAAATLLTAALMTTGAGAMAYKFGGRPGQEAKTNSGARDSPEVAKAVPAAAPAGRGSPKETLADKGRDPEVGIAGPRTIEPVVVSEKDSPRVRAAKELFNTSMAYFENGTITIDRAIDASRRLVEAEENANPRSDARVAAHEAHLSRMKKMTARQKSNLDAGVGSQPNLSLAAYAVLEGQDQVAQAKARPTAGSAGRAKAVGVNDDPSIGQKLDPPDDDEEEEMNQAIRAQLNKPISVPFADDTALEDAIKYIKSATVSPRLPEGIPIYVDPIALQDAEKTLQSPVKLALEGIKLKRTLRLLLKQLDLGYVVEHGFLTVVSLESEDAPWSLVKQLRGRGLMMGGGGGMGGAMGGPGPGGAVGRGGAPGSMGGAPAPGAGDASGNPGATGAGGAGGGFGGKGAGGGVGGPPGAMGGGGGFPGGGGGLGGGGGGRGRGAGGPAPKGPGGLE